MNQPHTKAHLVLSEKDENQTGRVKTGYTFKVQYQLVMYDTLYNTFENTGKTEIGRKLVKAELRLDF